jgi:ubiquinone/menaquinone biosynthesis C-methylase UbiE
MAPDSQAEFDAYGERYDQTVNAAISFSGLGVDFFTRVKADTLREIISANFKDPSNISVLDVGCGIGNSLALLSSHVGRPAGVDVSTACLETARGRTPGIDYAAYDGVHLPHADASFDLVYAICVFHHVAAADRSALMRDVRRVLRPGGVFVIFEHNPLNPLTMHIVNRCEFDRNAVLLRKQETEVLMQDAGLRDVSSRFILTVPPKGALLRQVDRMFSRLPLGTQYYTLGRV